MIEGIAFGEIKQAIQRNRDLAKRPEARLSKGGYGTKEGEVGEYDSSLESFGRTFDKVLPAGYEVNLKVGRLRKYIEDTLSTERGKVLTAAEFGGPGSNLFSDFTDNFFIKTAGVCLKDIRDKKTKLDDKQNRHSVIIGDILDVQSKQPIYQVVLEMLGTNKIDLIISRMMLPLRSIDKHPAILDRIARNWYEMLNENGVMFVQYGYHDYSFPVNNRELEMIPKWANTIQKRFPKIDVKVNRGTLRLHKRPGSPKKLPSAAELFRNT